MKTISSVSNHLIEKSFNNIEILEMKNRLVPGNVYCISHFIHVTTQYKSDESTRFTSQRITMEEQYNKKLHKFKNKQNKNLIFLPFISISKFNTHHANLMFVKSETYFKNQLDIAGELLTFLHKEKLVNWFMLVTHLSYCTEQTHVKFDCVDKRKVKQCQL